MCALAGCGRVAFEPSPDAGTPSDAPPCTEPFGAPQPLPTGGFAVQGPSVSDDERELYMAASIGGPELADLYLSTRASRSDAWSVPVHMVDPPSSIYDDTSPSISADGLDLYFSSTRMGNAFIFHSHRASNDATWDLPTHSGAYGSGDISHDGLSMAVTDFMSPVRFYRRTSSPSLSADGRELYFTSDRSGVRSIWVARRATDSGAYTSVEQVPLGVEAHEPEICADGNHLYMMVRVGGSDLPHVATRCE